MNFEFPQQIFENFSNSNFYENPSRKNEFFMRRDRRANRRRQRQRQVEANSLFPKLCERA